MKSRGQRLGIAGWGKKTTGWGTAIFLTMVVGQPGFAGSPGAEGREANLGITVRVYDYAHIPHETLIRAQEETRGIFRKAAVGTEWQHCPAKISPESGDSPCREVLGPSGVYMRILPASMAARLDSRREDLGFALGSGTPEAGSDAWVFYHRVEEVAERSGASLSVILGHAMAHEIGHLLLGLEPHSPKGIMRGGWHGEDFELVAQGQLTFTPEQSEQMRRAVMVRLRQAELIERHSEAVSQASIAEDRK